jgi:hypothetical protein
MQMTSESVGVFIAGSGNVAHRLAAAFAGSAVKLKGIVSKSSRGRRLAEIYGVKLFEEANLLPASGDVVLLCVKADALTREYFSLSPVRFCFVIRPVRLTLMFLATGREQVFSILCKPCRQHVK